MTGPNNKGTVEERVLDLSSRKRLVNAKDVINDRVLEGSPLEMNGSLSTQLDESEALGLQQHLGKLVERRGVGEVVETNELLSCLFGKFEQNHIRQMLLKEVQRDERATAAETRRSAT